MERKPGPVARRLLLSCEWTLANDRRLSCGASSSLSSETPSSSGCSKTCVHRASTSVSFNDFKAHMSPEPLRRCQYAV